jgi:hypothetical protein
MNWTLPQQLYLLSYDLDKGKLDPSSVLVRGQLLRAAAVAELTMRAWLKDQNGKAVRNTAVSLPNDLFLADVLDSVSLAKPRSWFTVVDHRWDRAEAVVRDQLAELGTIKAEKTRKLGFRWSRPVVLKDRDRVRALRDSTRNAVLLGGGPPDVSIAALVMLSVEGDVRSMFTPTERREHKQAFTAIADNLETVLPGLRKATELSIAARRGGAA